MTTVVSHRLAVLLGYWYASGMLHHALKGYNNKTPDSYNQRSKITLLNIFLFWKIFDIFIFILENVSYFIIVGNISRKKI